MEAEHSLMIQQKLVSIHAPQFPGHMLKTTQESVSSDVHNYHTDRTRQDNA
jgi:hypothetical protein